MRIRAALVVLAALLALGAARARAEGGATRHYYLAAEEVVWDYAPGGKALQHTDHGGGIPAPWGGNTRWKKVRFAEYTDAAFKTRKAQPAWLGVLGPVIRAEVGDTVIVHFLNRGPRPYSVHPHGVRYTKDHEGAFYPGAGRGGRVAPGARFDYTWTVDEGSGPGPGEASSTVWWYHSHVDEPADVNAGLLGPLVVTARGKARPDATPADVDREIVILAMIFDEAKGEERGLMHSVNGFIFGTLPPPTARVGERIRWYMLGMGNEKDLHTMHWHGKTLRLNARNTDVVELLPGSMATMDMIADNAGTWLLHCHVADHFNAGMVATYTIAP